MNIIQRIISQMEEKSIAYDEFARYLQINPSTLSTWKKRNTDPPAKLLPLIAQRLNVTIDYLITGNTDKKLSSNPSSTNNDHKLIQLYKQLDLEGQMLVLATAIEEYRRLKSNR